MIVFVKFTYPQRDPTAFKIVDTNMSKAGIIETVETYIHGSIGSGEDLREAENHEVYEIEIQVDLSEDIFRVTSNCNNDGLVLGILMTILGLMDAEDDQSVTSHTSGGHT